MKGTEAKLVSYMQGSDKRFIIPVYQRNYDWKTENCKQLYEDLVKVIKYDRHSHFFGSIVSVHNDGAYNEFLVIDGQQRLTTVSLLFLAMYNLMKEGVVTPTQSNLADKIYKTYLIDEWQPDDTRIKLKPVKDDKQAFDCLFGDKDDHIQGSNLTVNYNFFYTQIQKEEISIDELFTAITRLEIINITLGADDNPQLIFESLNSTGLALSEGDKIRNFILMGLAVQTQNEYFEKYWNKIEIYTGYDVSNFIRDYLSVKLQEIPSMNRVYATFKAYVEDAGIETESLLQDLLAYAKRYSILLNGHTSDKAMNACIDRLNRLETTVTRPFFLEVLRVHETEPENVPSAAVRDVFLLTESYLFRRLICDVPTNALNKIFLTLHKDIIKYDGTAENYFEKFKYTILSKGIKGRFPDDDEFTAAFSSRPVYLMNRKNKIYVFERFENHGTAEDKDIYRHCDEGIYSIEHIMPQHLTPTWTDALGTEYETIHEEWLHRIANLTLTAYNEKYSNSPFKEKRDMPNGFKDSGLRMNQWVGKQENWTLTELENRSALLMEKAIHIWPYPTSSFKPAEKQLESCTLDDDADLSGRLIARFGFKNTETPVDSWIDMMEQILKILHAEDKSVLTRLAYSDDDSNELNQYVNHNPNKLRATIQIDGDIYVERNTSTATKMGMLRKFFKEYGADPETLTFFLKDETNTDAATDETARYELRKKYWEFALPYIHAAHENGGSFHHVNPSKENWINGYFGIGGVWISCVANYSEARIDFNLLNVDTSLNKKRFDLLFSHKDEIEFKLGVQLEWQRGEKTKGSFIAYRLSDVSITKETDWTMMAKFHAEWSRKIGDVLVPYLK